MNNHKYANQNQGSTQIWGSPFLSCSSKGTHSRTLLPWLKPADGNPFRSFPFFCNLLSFVLLVTPQWGESRECSPPGSGVRGGGWLRGAQDLRREAGCHLRLRPQGGAYRVPAGAVLLRVRPAGRPDGGRCRARLCLDAVCRRTAHGAAWRRTNTLDIVSVEVGRFTTTPSPQKRQALTVQRVKTAKWFLKEELEMPFGGLQTMNVLFFRAS